MDQTYQVGLTGNTSQFQQQFAAANQQVSLLSQTVGGLNSQLDRAVNGLANMAQRGGQAVGGGIALKAAATIGVTAAAADFESNSRPLAAYGAATGQ